MDPRVEVLSLSYRESGFDTSFTGYFESDDPRLNRLMEKCARTLKVCMRDNFMDCPDRERGQWIGDVTVQAPQVFYLMDNNAKRLIKKGHLGLHQPAPGRCVDRECAGYPFLRASCPVPVRHLPSGDDCPICGLYRWIRNLWLWLIPPSWLIFKLWPMMEDGLVGVRKGDWILV